MANDAMMTRPNDLIRAQLPQRVVASWPSGSVPSGANLPACRLSRWAGKLHCSAGRTARAYSVTPRQAATW